MMTVARFTLALVCLLVSQLPACKKSETGSARPLIVGMDLSYPPFETIGVGGEPTGVSVDLAKALGESLGREVRIENMPFVGLIPSLKSGKIDLIISSMSDTPERRNSIAFSDPYVTTIGLSVLAGKDSGVRSVADLDAPGRRVVVRQGTTGQLWAQENLKNAQILVLDKESAAVMEIVQGRADAFLYDQLSVLRYHRQHPDDTVALLQPVKPEPWAIGLRQGEDGLRTEVNRFLREFRAQGGFSKLGDKYLADEKAEFARLGFPFSF